MTIELAADNNDFSGDEAEALHAYRLAAQAAVAARPEVATYFDEAERLATGIAGPLES